MLMDSVSQEFGQDSGDSLSLPTNSIQGISYKDSNLRVTQQLRINVITHTSG